MRSRFGEQKRCKGSREVRLCKAVGRNIYEAPTVREEKDGGVVEEHEKTNAAMTMIRLVPTHAQAWKVSFIM